MTSDVKNILVRKLTALADDELILSHRNSEWTGHAPILEEDIALANIAQDELGHAGLWLEFRKALDGSDPDKLVFFRDAEQYRNVQMVELPRGDWAFTMLRQYLFDTYEYVLLEKLAESTHTPVKETAQKIRKEERFHLQHTHLWVERLGQGTDESRRRLQHALDELWPYAQQLFIPLAGEDLLTGEGTTPEPERVKEAWLEQVLPHLAQSGVQVPQHDAPPTRSREEHTAHLSALLDEMQEVARLEPEAVW
jgi:ring-1,2-phenylacetyl-CoA epoxidase subunit PaaC